MGSSSWAIKLDAIAGETAAPWDQVRAATLAVIRARWERALGIVWPHAWEWVSDGADSLLALGEPGQPEDKPTDAIRFRFDLTASWPSDLADHWVALAVAEGRPELEAALGELGYHLGGDCPTLDSVTGRFFIDGEHDRIGLAGGGGVFWQLPVHEHQPYEALSDEIRQLAERTRDGGGCRCLYCSYAGLGGYAIARPAVTPARPAATPPVQHAAKPATTKHAAKPANKPAVSKQPAKQANKPAAKKHASKPAAKKRPAKPAANKRLAKQAKQTSKRPAKKPAKQPAKQSARKPAPRSKKR